MIWGYPYFWKHPYSHGTSSSGINAIKIVDFPASYVSLPECIYIQWSKYLSSQVFFSQHVFSTIVFVFLLFVCHIFFVTRKSHKKNVQPFFFSGGRFAPWIAVAFPNGYRNHGRLADQRGIAGKIIRVLVVRRPPIIMGSSEKWFPLNIVVTFSIKKQPFSTEPWLWEKEFFDCATCFVYST